MKEYFQDMNAIQDEIESTLSSSDTAAHDILASDDRERDAVETRFYDILALVNKILNAPSPLGDLDTAFRFYQTQ